MMREVCDLVSAAGLPCVDGGFVGSDRMLGDGTTLYLSGPDARLVASSLASALRVRVLGEEVGMASGLKLAFAGLNKGLTALFLELACLAGQANLADPLLAAWRDFYPETIAVLERVLPSYPRHARRRVQELAELERWLRELGHDPGLIGAARAELQELERMGLSSQRDWTAREIVDACQMRRSHSPLEE
jgi:hypothetical protein